MEDNERWASRIISELFDEQLPDSWETGPPLTNTVSSNDTNGNDTSPYVNSAISDHSDFESFQFSRRDGVNSDSAQNNLSDYVQNMDSESKITNYSLQEGNSYKNDSVFSALTMDQRVNSYDPVSNCCRNMNGYCDQDYNSLHTPTNNVYQSCENHSMQGKDDNNEFLNDTGSSISEEEFNFESCRSSPASKASTAEKTNKEDRIRWKFDPVDTDVNIQNAKKCDSFKNRTLLQKTSSDLCLSLLDLHETRNEKDISVDVEDAINNKENISVNIINVIKHSAVEDENSLSADECSLMYSRIVSSTSQSPDILSVCAGDFEISKNVNTYYQSSLSFAARKGTESLGKRGDYENDCQFSRISDSPISFSHELQLKLEDKYMDESKQFIVYVYRKMAKAIEICFVSPLSVHIMGTIELLEFIVVLIICIFYELLCKFFINNAYKIKTKIAHQCLKSNDCFSNDTENANAQRKEEQISISGIISAIPCESLISFSSESSTEQEHAPSTVETLNAFVEESALSNSENESETPSCFVNDSGDQNNKFFTNENMNLWKNEKYMPMTYNLDDNNSLMEDVNETKHLSLISLTEISSSFLTTSINHSEEQDSCGDIPLIKSPEYLFEGISLNSQISNEGSHWEALSDLEKISIFNESNSIEISASKSSGNIILSDDEKESEMLDKWDAFNILFKHDIYPVSDNYTRNFSYDDNNIDNIQNNSSLDVNCSIDSETKSMLGTPECFHPKSEWTEEESSFNLNSKPVALKEQLQGVQSSPNLNNSIIYSSKTCRSQSMPLLEGAWKDDEIANEDGMLRAVEMIAENQEFNNIDVKEYSDVLPSNLGDSCSFPFSNDQVDTNEFHEVNKNIQVRVTGDILPGVSSEPFDVQSNTSPSESEDNLKPPAQNKSTKEKSRKGIISQISAAFQGFKKLHFANSTDRRKKYKKHFDEQND